MSPMSEAMTKVIIDAGSRIVAVVARINALPLSNDAALRSWVKDFAVAVTHYRGVTRILTKQRDRASYAEAAEVRDALVAADNFLLRNTHWSWDEEWFDSRWKRAAQERKKIWEAEEERIQKLKEERDNIFLLSEAQRFLHSDVVSFEYPTDEEWEALHNQASSQEPISPIDSFGPQLSPRSLGSSPSSGSDMSSSRSPPPTAPTPFQSPKIAAGNIHYIWDDEVSSPRVGHSSSRTDSIGEVAGTPYEEPTGQIGLGGAGINGEHVGPAKAVGRTDASQGHGSDPISRLASTGAGMVTRPPVDRPTLPTTKGLKLKPNLTVKILPDHKINNQSAKPRTKPNAAPFTSQAPKRPQFSQLTVSTLSQLECVRISSAMSPSTSRRNKRARDDDDDDYQTDDEDTRYVRYEGGTLIGTGQTNSPSCLSCSKANSKCFRLNGKSCCARCYQEHQKCPLDKPNTKKHRPSLTVG
ncbi:hypothetical protein J3R30DRAFT_2711481 [Lentinula aciculospora]|uniref:Uncharacterized protein n=1 Tax=Lentinula aciculospora TaxID=153920 RepID=A0A9W9ABK7_9AGAR|nr:hypothetical protein J3R30DRAFT_2711481 [Lentinula aciculospora]